MIAPLRSGFDIAPAARRVSIQPGATALTRMPSGAKATACERVICTTAPLLAAYAGLRGEPKNDHIDARLTTLPRDFASAARNARVTSCVPARFTSITLRKPSAVN